MGKWVCSVVASAVLCSAQACFAGTSKKISSLCELQQGVAQGEHVSVAVPGVYLAGFEQNVLTDTRCPNEATAVRFELQSQRNDMKLRELLDRDRHAYVVFQGEFYGPPLPDPKLPEALRRAVVPGWGHLAAFRTQLVVRSIGEVRAARPGEVIVRARSREEGPDKRTAD